MRTAHFGGHCEQNDWQTGVKTLPCPKLRLRAVRIYQGMRDMVLCVMTDKLHIAFWRITVLKLHTTHNTNNFRTNIRKIKWYIRPKKVNACTACRYVDFSFVPQNVVYDSGSNILRFHDRKSSNTNKNILTWLKYIFCSIRINSCNTGNHSSGMRIIHFSSSGGGWADPPGSDPPGCRPLDGYRPSGYRPPGCRSHPLDADSHPPDADPPLIQTPCRQTPRCRPLPGCRHPWMRTPLQADPFPQPSPPPCEQNDRQV